MHRRLAFPRREGLAGLLLVLGLFAVFVAVQRPYPPSWDGGIMYTVTRSLGDHHTLRVPDAPVVIGDHLLIPRSSKTVQTSVPYSHYGIGVSLLLLPFYLVQRGLGLPDPVIVTLAEPLVLALTAWLVWRTARRLGARPMAAMLGALAFGLLSMALPYSTELLSEPLVGFGLALLVHGAIRSRDGCPTGLLEAGTGVAVALLARSDSTLLVGCGLLVLPWISGMRRLRDPLQLASLLVPMAAAVGWTSWYAHLREGGWWPGVYGGHFDVGFWTGFLGMTVGFGKGFLWYSPFLVLGLGGLILLWRRDRAVAVLMALLILVRPLFYAKWTYWSGEVAWGPRFLVPLCPLLAVLAGLLLDRIGELRPRVRGAAVAGVAALASAGALVSVLSVWTGYDRWWSVLHRPLSPGEDVQAQLAGRFGWRYGGLHGSWQLIGDVPLPMRHFAGGASVVGVVAVLVALLGVVGAIVLVSRQEDQPTTPPPRATLPDRPLASDPVVG